MASGSPLHAALATSVRQFPHRTAVVEPGGGTVTYAQLDAISAAVRDHLAFHDVGVGDRVAFYMRKSTDAVAAMYGVLRVGAAYVPLDPQAPPARNAFILHNCAVKVVFVELPFAARMQEELDAIGATPRVVVVPSLGGGEGILTAAQTGSSRTVDDAPSAPSDLAYILYTSGSTGKPKGVMLSHENAVSFVDWCGSVFSPTEEDRFSSHAPFHFDLSILDLHVCFRYGATLVLVSDDAGKDPVRLGALIAEQKISIWYSAPSILSLIAQFGDLRAHDYSHLRTVLFAGEVFPVKHLRTLCQLWPRPRYYNLYGPTETNVCTYQEVIPPVPEERTAPYPIGTVCSHLSAKVVDDQGATVAAGSEGELCIAGRGVMQGYWALPQQTENAFLRDPDGVRWYRTGDIVVDAGDGVYTYRGRRDRMVKRRAYRVELGEIEAALYQHPNIKEVATVALPDEESGVRIIAHVSTRDGGRISLIEIRRFCAERMPAYMVPDAFSWYSSLPKTSTDKIDYQRLKEMS